MNNMGTPNSSDSAAAMIADNKESKQLKILSNLASDNTQFLVVELHKTICFADGVGKDGRLINGSQAGRVTETITYEKVSHKRTFEVAGHIEKVNVPNKKLKTDNSQSSKDPKPASGNSNSSSSSSGIAAGATHQTGTGKL